jgi:ribosomal protein S7
MSLMWRCETKVLVPVGRVCTLLLLQDYIAVKEKNAKYLPHSAGRYAAKRFRKAQCPIVERLTNSLMMHGRNNGKKLMAVRIVKHAFEIIHLLTGEVSMLTSLEHGFRLVSCLAYLTLRMEAVFSPQTLVDSR